MADSVVSVGVNNSKSKVNRQVTVKVLFLNRRIIMNVFLLISDLLAT